MPVLGQPVILPSVVSLMALLAAMSFAALCYFRNSILAEKGQVRRRAGRGLLILGTALTCAAAALLLLGFVILWLAGVARISKAADRGLAFGVMIATLLSSGVLMSALFRWVIASPENRALPSVRLPFGYWVIEYSAVLIVCAWIGMLAESWRAGALAFVVLPLGAVFPRVFRAWVGPIVMKLRMRSFFGELRARQAADDVSSLQAWADEISPKYGIKNPPAVIPVTGGRSLSTYAVPSESAILLGVDHLKAMGEPERKALTAHELAHIVRNEGKRRISAEALITVWYLGLFLWWMTKHPAAPFSARFVWLLVYSYVMQSVRVHLMRRSEFAADRLAAAMLGGPSSLISALKKTAAAKKTPDLKTRTHPALSARIAALEELA